MSSLKNYVEGEHYRVDESGCWIWLGAIDAAGYPHTSGNIERRAHRATFAEVNGPIPPGHHIHHRCKTPACVNPEHLQMLTPRMHFLEHKLHEQTGLRLADIVEIRKLGRTAGVTAKAVAEQYGIHEITVYNYWGKEQVWADLLDDEPMHKPVRVCRHCDEEFSERNRNAVYCSVECRVAFNNAKQKAA